MHNAVNYTPENGTVSMSVSRQDRRVILRIADTGPGIAEEQRERVFDPFYRILGTKASGTGLGLAICKTIAERNNVGLKLDWTDTQAKTGLAVTLTMPVAQ
ncbi:MAG: ATP-binding protein [Sutterellaceae bacterium]|nr:ATP-binding protein [Sutterellaceae bacterium]